jgi:hypothetical protein
MDQLMHLSHQKRNYVNVAKIIAFAVVLVSTTPVHADNSIDFSPVERATAKHDLNDAMNELDKLNLSGGDELLKLLNKGMLLRMQGDYAQSNVFLEKSRQLIEQLQAIRDKEKAGSVELKDISKAYEVLPTEHLELYALEALNFLASGKFQDEAVQPQKFDARQVLLAKKHNNASYLSGAFVRYLNGLIFEKQGAKDDARIEFKRAIDGYNKQGMKVPQLLSDSLKRLESSATKEIAITLILQNGLGPTFEEHITQVTNPYPGPNSPAIFNLPLPSYISRPAPVDHIELSVGTATAKSELVEDLTALGEKSFNDQFPLLRERAISRLAGKINSATANKTGYDPLEGTVVVATVNEKADTRSWSLLPGNILMVSVPALPDGKALPVSATYFDAKGNKLAEKNFGTVTPQKGTNIYLSDYFINPNSILTPAPTSGYVSGPTQSRLSSESFTFFGVGIDINLGGAYSTLESQITKSSGSSISSTTTVPDLSIYFGGYSGTLGWEVGYTAIGGERTNYSKPGSTCCIIVNDAYAIRGDAFYGEVLWRANTTNDFFYLKGGLAGATMNLQNGGGIYTSSSTSTTGYGPILGGGWQSGAFRFELQSLRIQLPTPTPTNIDGSIKTSTMLTTFNLGVVF